jgi:hypothetical protein
MNGFWVLPNAVCIWECTEYFLLWDRTFGSLSLFLSWESSPGAGTCCVLPLNYIPSAEDDLLSGAATPLGRSQEMQTTATSLLLLYYLCLPKREPVGHGGGWCGHTTTPVVHRRVNESGDKGKTSSEWLCTLGPFLHLQPLVTGQMYLSMLILASIP